MATRRSSASWKKWRGRKRVRAAPAPELHPPGFSGGQPQRQGYRIEPRNDVERRFLHDVTSAQVRGEARGMPDVMRSDWDRVKLAEARWAREIIEKRPVQIVAVDRLRSVRPEFRSAARIMRRAEKRQEAENTRSRLEQQLSRDRGANQNTPPPPPSGNTSQAEKEVVRESAFMAGLRARAKALAERDDLEASYAFERQRRRER